MAGPGPPRGGAAVGGRDSGLASELPRPIHPGWSTLGRPVRGAGPVRDAVAPLGPERPRRGTPSRRPRRGTDSRDPVRVARALRGSPPRARPRERAERSDQPRRRLAPHAAGRRSRRRGDDDPLAGDPAAPPERHAQSAAAPGPGGDGLTPLDWRGELVRLAEEAARRTRHAADRLERLIDRDPYHVAG